MRPARTARKWLPVLTLALLACGATARADWLVLHDGSRLEVKGPWKVSGRQVVFTSIDGKLSSLRADLVDLDASAAATAKAAHDREAQAAETAEAPESSKGPKAKAKWSLTDKDFARPEAEEPKADGGSDKPGAPAAAPPKSDLDVVVWSQSVDPGRNRIRVSGTLQNGGKDMAASVALEVQLVDRQGVVVGAQQALLQKLSLAPGESTDFSTTFPQIINYEKVKFAPTASMFKVEPKEDKEKPAAPPTP